MSYREELIKIEFLGIKDKLITRGSCNCSSNGCSGCSSNGCSGGCKGDNKGCSGCSSGCKWDNKGCHKEETTEYQAYLSLESFLYSSDVGDFISIEFKDIKAINDSEKELVERLTKKGFFTPFILIDGIVRYYSGVSNKLIYKDILELL